MKRTQLALSLALAGLGCAQDSERAMMKSVAPLLLDSAPETEDFQHLYELLDEVGAELESAKIDWRGVNVEPGRRGIVVYVVDAARFEARRDCSRSSEAPACTLSFVGNCREWMGRAIVCDARLIASLRIAATSRALKLSWSEFSRNVRMDEEADDGTWFQQLERVLLTQGHELTRQGGLKVSANWTIASMEGGCSVSLDKCRKDIETLELAIHASGPRVGVQIDQIIEPIVIGYLAMLLYHEIGHLQSRPGEVDSIHLNSEEELAADKFAREHAERLSPAFVGYVGPFLYLDLAGSFLRLAMTTSGAELSTAEEWLEAPAEVIDRVQAEYIGWVCDGTHPSYFRRYLETASLAGYVYPDAAQLEKVTTRLDQACGGEPIDAEDFRRYGMWLLGA